ncbi:hypothetical protein RB597_007183 [Gaeumannomyces tritici]
MESAPSSAMRCLALFCLLFALEVHAFYIPGWSIRSYKEKEEIPLLVNKVYSDHTQLQYAYYDLPFVCPPTGARHGGLLSGQTISLNLGEVLRGDRIAYSDLELSMMEDRPCNLLCNREISRGELNRAVDMVRDGYVVEWIVDNLPGATSFVTVDKSRKYYASGFKLGFTDQSSGRPHYFLNNHHTIVVRYRNAPGKAGERGGKVIVAFEVYTKSVGPDVKRDASGCPADTHSIEQNFELFMRSNRSSASSTAHAGNPYHQAEEADMNDDSAKLTIPYTYSVYFREDTSIEWSRRWDLYFVNQEEGSRIHWLAIVNSLVICCLLTAVTLMILARTVRTDIKGYKDRAEEGKSRLLRKGAKSPVSRPRSPRLLGEKSGGGLLEQEAAAAEYADEVHSSEDEQALEDVTGWKLLHGDVFRSPALGFLLAPLVGSGMQLLFMAVGLVLLSALGVLNPSFRGGFISFGLGLFVVAGTFAGYFSARIYRTFEGKDWRRNTLITALLIPGLLFGVVFVVNLFVWAQASSTAIPFGRLIALLFLWLAVQLPLVYVGSWYGFVRAGSWDHPTKTIAMPRQVPLQPWYLKGFASILLAGVIPFVVIFIELLFVFQSVWQDKSGYYYVFGFLAMVSFILIITVAEVTVVTIYVQLCHENHQWWWQSFFIGGSSSVLIFLYCIWYYFTSLHITGFVSSVLFFTYSFMACCVYGLLTGTVGFLSAYAFIRRIYGAIKVD